MSLEQQIEKLTAALEANTKALLGSGGGKSSGGGSSSSGGGKSTKKELTVDDLGKKFSAYLAAEGDEAKANVRKIVQKFGVKKITALDPSDFEEALAILAKLEDGEDPFEDEGGSLV